eukprot:2381451-Rhodomonas_salina.2
MQWAWCLRPTTNGSAQSLPTARRALPSPRSSSGTRTLCGSKSGPRLRLSTPGKVGAAAEQTLAGPARTRCRLTTDGVRSEVGARRPQRIGWKGSSTNGGRVPWRVCRPFCRASVTGAPQNTTPQQVRLDSHRDRGRFWFDRWHRRWSDFGAGLAQLLTFTL